MCPHRGSDSECGATCTCAPLLLQRRKARPKTFPSAVSVTLVIVPTGRPPASIISACRFNSLKMTPGLYGSLITKGLPPCTCHDRCARSRLAAQAEAPQLLLHCVEVVHLRQGLLPDIAALRQAYGVIQSRLQRVDCVRQLCTSLGSSLQAAPNLLTAISITHDMHAEGG